MSFSCAHVDAIWNLVINVLGHRMVPWQAKGALALPCEGMVDSRGSLVSAYRPLVSDLFFCKIRFYPT